MTKYEYLHHTIYSLMCLIQVIFVMDIQINVTSWNMWGSLHYWSQRSKTTIFDQVFLSFYIDILIEGKVKNVHFTLNLKHFCLFGFIGKVFPNVLFIIRLLSNKYHSLLPRTQHSLSVLEANICLAPSLCNSNKLRLVGSKWKEWLTNLDGK